MTAQDSFPEKIKQIFIEMREEMLAKAHHLTVSPMVSLRPILYMLSKKEDDVLAVYAERKQKLQQFIDKLQCRYDRLAISSEEGRVIRPILDFLKQYLKERG